MKENDRRYAVIYLIDLDLIDFTQIEETSSKTIKKSLDDTQFVIKWQDGYTPTFITDASVVNDRRYAHHAILELMATDKWSEPIQTK